MMKNNKNESNEIAKMIKKAAIGCAVFFMMEAMVSNVFAADRDPQVINIHDTQIYENPADVYGTTQQEQTNAVAEQQAIAMAYMQKAANYDYYCFYDMNKDGTDDLLISDAKYRVLGIESAIHCTEADVYTYIKGKVVYVGHIGTAMSPLMVDEKDDLICAWWGGAGTSEYVYFNHTEGALRTEIYSWHIDSDTYTYTLSDENGQEIYRGAVSQETYQKVESDATTGSFVQFFSDKEKPANRGDVYQMGLMDLESLLYATGDHVKEMLGEPIGTARGWDNRIYGCPALFEKSGQLEIAYFENRAVDVTWNGTFESEAAACTFYNTLCNATNTYCKGTVRDLSTPSKAETKWYFVSGHSFDMISVSAARENGTWTVKVNMILHELG